MAMIIQTTQVYCASLVYICFMIVFFGMCIFLMALVADIENGLAVIEDKLASSTKLHGLKIAEMHSELKASLNKIVRFHSDAKQLRELSIRCSLGYLALE